MTIFNSRSTKSIQESKEKRIESIRHNIEEALDGSDIHEGLHALNIVLLDALIDLDKLAPAQVRNEVANLMHTLAFALEDTLGDDNE